jgi:sugar (pentulose or hexulose) kinase
MAETLLVGLDVGTTSVKAAVVTADGTEVAHGRATTPWQATATGAELDADALLSAGWDAINQALSLAPDGTVAGVGVTSMGESGVLVDRHGRPVTPVVAWYDVRDDAEARLLSRELGARFSAQTGLPLRSQWSLTKHRWLVRHVPDVTSAARRFNIGEWVVRGLSGVEASDLSLASRTGWLDLRGRAWWSESLEWSGIAESLLPPLAPSGEPLGKVSSEDAPVRLRGAAVAVAGHDHQAAAVGAGASGPGDELDSCGTAEALVRAVPLGLSDAAISELVETGITVGWHVLRDHWSLLGATRGGLLLRRVLDLLGRSSAGLPVLDAAARSLPDAADMRITDRMGAGLDITAIRDGASPGLLWRAAVDSATEQAAALHSVITRVSGQHRQLAVTGGWANSTALLEAKERLMGPLTRPAVTEAGARGAALLGGLCAGVYADVRDFPRPALLRPVGVSMHSSFSGRISHAR